MHNLLREMQEFGRVRSLAELGILGFNLTPFLSRWVLDEVSLRICNLMKGLNGGFWGLIGLR